MGKNFGPGDRISKADIDQALAELCTLPGSVIEKLVSLINNSVEVSYRQLQIPGIMLRMRQPNFGQGSNISEQVFSRVAGDLFKHFPWISSVNLAAAHDRLVRDQSFKLDTIDFHLQQCQGDLEIIQTNFQSVLSLSLEDRLSIREETIPLYPRIIHLFTPLVLNEFEKYLISMIDHKSSGGGFELGDYRQKLEVVNEAWRNLCVEAGIVIPDEEDIDVSAKQFFLTDCLEKALSSGDGDPERIPVEHLVLFLDNEHLIPRQRLQQLLSIA